MKRFLWICWIAYWQCTSETAVTENAYQIFCYPGEIIHIIMIHIYMYVCIYIMLQLARYQPGNSICWASTNFRRYVVALSPLARNYHILTNKTNQILDFDERHSRRVWNILPKKLTEKNTTFSSFKNGLYEYYKSALSNYDAEDPRTWKSIFVCLVTCVVICLFLYCVVVSC